jgi:periplasmic protein TonB
MDLQERPPRRRLIRRRSEPTFWLALSAAALLHAGLILEIGRAAPRVMGEQNGAPDSLSVELVDASQLRSKSTIPPRAESGSSPPATAAAPPSPVPAEPSTAPSTPEVISTIPPEQKKKRMEKATEQPIDTQAPEVAAPPSPPRKPSEAARKPREKSPPEQKQSSLQLDLPQNFSASPGSGWSTGATRPPDITRSGENDEFGRGVIRALRRTMPEPRGETGRVTVRLLLSDTGNLAELQLIRGATDPTLTQSVVFAVRQSSFPIPPAGATVSDRTFLVTYVYN